MIEHGEVSLATLLRAARRVFATDIREALARAGHEDIPANGLFVIGAIARGGVPMGVCGNSRGRTDLYGQQLVSGYRGRRAQESDSFFESRF